MVTADERVGARMAGAEKAETDSRRARATVAIIFCERGKAAVSGDGRGEGPLGGWLRAGDARRPSARTIG